MGRHRESQIKAFGISNALRARGFTRSQELSRSRKNHRMSAGFQADQIDENSVSIKHFLGNNHGIVEAAERTEIVEKALISYALALEGPYSVRYKGEGEQAYLVVQDPVDPVIGETLRKAAALLRELPGSAARTTNAKIDAEHLERWADLADKGENW